jgi:hypothetical protein
MVDEPIPGRLRLVVGQEPSRLEQDPAPGAGLGPREQLGPILSWADLLVALAVCVPFWAGLTLLLVFGWL